MPSSREKSRGRATVLAGSIELLNGPWQELCGCASPRSCPICNASVSGTDNGVRHGGEVYHPGCTRYRRDLA